MRYYSSKFQKNTIASIVFVAMLLVMLYSSFFVAKNLHHDCCGEHCETCIILHQCADNLNNIKNEFGAGVVIPLPIVMVSAGAMFYILLTASATPVSTKVRLNN